MAASSSLNIRNVRAALVKYLPYCACGGYSIAALNTMNVSLPVGKDARLALFNGSLCVSNIGMAVYLYNRPALDIIKPPKSKRFIWSCFGSGLFNLGSLLSWAIAKEFCPENKVVRFVVALSIAGGLLFVATDYLIAVDSLKKAVIAERESQD